MSHAMNKAFARGWMIAVYAFLYLPIVTLVIYSFNDSRLVPFGAMPASGGITRW